MSFLRYIISKLYFIPLIYGNWYQRKMYILPEYQKMEGRRNKEQREEKIVIHMVLNETTFSGGLSDRLRGMVSVYKMCKEKNLPFRIYCQTPNLTDHLVPNKYNWIIDKEELSFDTKECYPCSILTYHKLNSWLQTVAQRVMLKWCLSKKHKQIHVYTNMLTGEDEFCLLYNELFKPSNDLQKQIDYHLEKIGGANSYISIVFRFRQLLGDFKEGGETLPENEREPYIRKCIGLIERMHKEQADKKILVTSDSGTFLEEVDKLPYTYIIPGKVVHMGFTYDANKDVYMKSFVDMYLLANANLVILARDKKMYHSGFALRASMLTNTEYQEINI